MNSRRSIPKWLLATGLIVLLLSLLTGTLVVVARKQPADDQQCLKITPYSGDFSYVYVDANSGTRLDIHKHKSYEQLSDPLRSPDGSNDAILFRSANATTSGIALKNSITGSWLMRPFDVYDLGVIEWSSDSKYLAVSNPGITPDAGELAVFSGHDLSDVVRMPASTRTGIWATHSNRLAFIEQRPDQTYWLSILTVDSEGKVSRLPGVVVPDINEGWFLLEWSPNDQYIAISTADYSGVASADGGEFQLISHQGIVKNWIPGTTTLSLMGLNDTDVLSVYDILTRATQTRSTDVIFDESRFSPDGRYAILSHVGSSPELRVYSIMDLATGHETELGKYTLVNEIFMGNTHWSTDNQSVVLILPDEVVWTDMHDPLHLIVHELPVELINLWDFLPDNSWIQLVQKVGPMAGVPQFLNLRTGEHYIWKHTDSPKDISVYYWPNSLIGDMQYDGVRGSIKRVTSENPFTTVDLENGPIPWLANTKYLVSVGSDPNATVDADSIVHVRRLDGTSLWTFQAVGHFRNDPDTARWINCETLR